MGAQPSHTGVFTGEPWHVEDDSTKASGVMPDPHVRCPLATGCMNRPEDVRSLPVALRCVRVILLLRITLTLLFIGCAGCRLIT